MSKNKFLPILALCVALGFTACDHRPRQLVVLCSNDTHSQVEPCADGMGGYAARKHFIDSVRHACGNVLLLDAGDIFQGTPYFNPVVLVHDCSHPNVGMPFFLILFRIKSSCFKISKKERS